MSSTARNRRFVGQQTSIANEIKRNLRNYTDAQLLSELLQNADDAKASRVAFMLDERHHGTARLGGLGSRVAELQDAALLCFDDAVFQEENFEGLFRFGVGSKCGDPTQTGRFGLGFNAVYHITECPMLVSGRQLLILDPQRQYLDGLRGHQSVPPGMMISFAAERPGAMDDLFQAFECFGCNISAPERQDYYPGTLFRFPLRTTAQAATSELRRDPTSVAAVKAMLAAFAAGG